MSKLCRAASVVLLLPLLAGSTNPTLTARVQIQMLSSAVAAYHADVGEYPSTSDGLQALLAPPSRLAGDARYRSGAYLGGGRVPSDPWGHPYVYRYPGEQSPEQFEILSLGADGQPGGFGFDADLTSWSEEGYEEHHRQRWREGRFAAAALGVASAAALGLLFYVPWVIKRSRAGLPLRRSAAGWPAACFAAVLIAGAVLGFLGGIL
jgi:type II secretion system protein G